MAMVWTTMFSLALARTLSSCLSRAALREDRAWTRDSSRGLEDRREVSLR